MQFIGFESDLETASARNKLGRFKPNRPKPPAYRI
jgi:hypothetical protein